MDSPHYFTLHIQNVSHQWEDILTADLFDIGAEGVQENLQFVHDREFAAKAIEADIKTLIAYFSAPPEQKDLENLQVQYPSVKIFLGEHAVQDWLAEWKKQWRPFALVDNVWIVPSWEKAGFDHQSRKPLYIDPGMAFGTGTHETTQIAARLLIDAIGDLEIKSLVDVGTGSGILAILARLQGVESVFAYDNDAECWRVFNENQANNVVGAMEWVENWPHVLRGKIDLTMANIIDGVLLNLKTDFQSVASPYYIFTGILEERESEFLQEMLRDWPLQQLARQQKGEWVGFLFKAP